MESLKNIIQNLLYMISNIRDISYKFMGYIRDIQQVLLRVIELVKVPAYY